jgi:hypothetical protein
VQPAGDRRHRQALYDAFTAAVILHRQIVDDTNELLQKVDSLPPTVPERRRLPNVTSVECFPRGSSSSRLEFEITRSYAAGQWNRFLYHADNVSNKTPILVKFTRRYSTALHKFCADRGHAPQLLGFENLPGGWMAVVMEYLESAQGLQEAWKSGGQGDAMRWQKEMAGLVKDFHDAGFVHGDLRDANFVVTNSGVAGAKDRKIMLLDFDWGGKEGEVFFPSGRLHSELLQTVGEHLKITKESDNQVLQTTLSKLP